MRILINTPAGNIGKVLTAQLLAMGHDITMISRNPKKVASFVSRGARLIEGSIDDTEVLRRASEGADVLFWLPPLVLDQLDFLQWARTCADRIAAIAADEGVKRAVLLSSIGAQHDHGVGPIACLPHVEQVFQHAFVDMVCLRPGHFMENFLMSLPTILSEGRIYSSHAADQAIPMIATRDIANAAAAIIADDVWKGHHTIGLHGPADVSYSDAAKIIGAVLGRPVSYIQISDEEMAGAMVSAGMPANMAQLVCGLYAGIRAGRVRRVEPRNATPTSLEVFARDTLLPLCAAA